MTARPYIEQLKVAKEYRTGQSSSSRPNCYVSGPLNKEVVGSDGRLDYFRAECRECGHKHITRRGEHSTRYYKCRECQTWHFINKGRFSLDRFPTKPLTNDEFSEQLFRIKLSYSESEFDKEGSWFYGSKETLREKARGDFWDTVLPLERVE